MENRKTSIPSRELRFLASEPGALCLWIALIGLVVTSLASGPELARESASTPLPSTRTALDEEAMRPLDPPDPVLSRPFELRFESVEARDSAKAQSHRLLYADRRKESK